MQVNPIIYPTTHTVNYIEYSNSIIELANAGLLNLNEIWDSSNCYTGYKGLDGLLCSQISFGKFTNNIEFAPIGEPLQVNLRPFFYKSSSSTFAIPTLTQKWTNLESMPAYDNYYGLGTWCPITKFDVNKLCYYISVIITDKQLGNRQAVAFETFINDWPAALVKNGYDDNNIVTGFQAIPYCAWDDSGVRYSGPNSGIFFVAEVVTSEGIFYTVPMWFNQTASTGSGSFMNYNIQTGNFVYTPQVYENRYYDSPMIVTKSISDTGYFNQILNAANISLSGMTEGTTVCNEGIFVNRRNATNFLIGSYWNKEKIEKTISGLGVYWTGNKNSATSSDLGVDCTDPLIHLGVIDPADGMTDGTYVSGTAVADEPQANWDDFSENEYTPIDPESSIGESDQITGDSIEGNWIGARSGDGFITQYCLTADQFSTLGDDLWNQMNNEIFWESITGTTSETTSIEASLILDYVVSLRVYPFKLGDMPSYASVPGTTMFFGLGKAGVDIGGGSLGKLTDTCDTLSGGSYYISPLYNNFLDYNPYTTVSVYIPYCGNVELNTKEVMGRTLSIRYHIDYNTGAMAAIVYVSEGDKTYPVAIKSGTIGATIQLSSANSSQLASNIINAGMNQLSTGTNAISGAVKGAVTGAAAGGVVGAVTGAIGGAIPSITKGLESAAQSSLNAKLIPPATFGQTSGFSSLGAPQRAYVTIRRPTVYNPSNYGHTVGNIYNAAKDINELKGFTICNNVDTSGIVATEKERNQIKQILESGFYA